MFTFLRRYGLPVLMIAAGGAVLFAQAQEYDWISLIWPIFIMLPGLPLLYIAWESHEAGRVRLIFPGAIITGTGVILQYQVLTEHWYSWTYAWALYAVLFGLSLVFQGRRLKVQQDVRTGRLMTVGGVVGFVVLWLLFETVVFSGLYAGIMSYLAAGLLIGGGVLWGLNRFRVARILAAKQVIHAKAPEAASGGDVDQIAERKQTDLRQQLQERRARMGQLPEAVEVTDTTAESGSTEAVEGVVVSEATPAPDATTTAGVAEVAEIDEADMLTEYRPPKEITVEGHEPTTDIDPDLDAKIRAALDDES